MLMKKILNVSEMKQVRGGAQPSSSCGEGELLYTCTSSWMGGATTSGSVCAKSAKGAEKAVDKIRITQDVLADQVVVLCY
jgi:hypothetical protein